MPQERVQSSSVDGSPTKAQRKQEARLEGRDKDNTFEASAAKNKGRGVWPTGGVASRSSKRVH